MESLRRKRTDFSWNPGFAAVSLIKHISIEIMKKIKTFTFFSNPRLDIKWSHIHRLHHHLSHRNHRHQNVNHVENIKIIKDSPLLPADYQY